MTERTSSSPANRAEMLAQRVSPQDAACLRKHADRVRKFIQAGKALGFFEVSPDSRSARYAIARHNLLPEAPLASLFNNVSPEQVEGFIKNALEDPAGFVRKLIDESQRLGNAYQQRTGKVGAIGIDVARNAIAGASADAPVAELLKNLVDCPPPDEELPDWFQVMHRYQLMPEDIDIVLAQGVTPSNDSQVTDPLNDTHDDVQRLVA